MDKDHLDYVLVPIGLLLMLAYHFWLLRRIILRSTTTIIGLNAINRRLWVRSMTQDTPRNGVLAVQTLRNNIMASSVLASTAIMLSSLIAALISGRSGEFLNGDDSKLGFSIKFFAILVCFLLAFILNVQSIRYYSHASILINVPSSIPLASKGSVSSSNAEHERERTRMRVDCVARVVNRGSYFWSMGLRAFYFSFPLFLWIFGSVPMLSCCFVLVIVLYFLDVNFYECELSEQEEVCQKEEEEACV